MIVTHVALHTFRSKMSMRQKHSVSLLECLM